MFSYGTHARIRAINPILASVMEHTVYKISWSKNSSLQRDPLSLDIVKWAHTRWNVKSIFSKTKLRATKFYSTLPSYFLVQSLSRSGYNNNYKTTSVGHLLIQG